MSTRRKFLQQSALATVGTMLMPHFLKALEHGGAVPSSEKTLVVVQLSGGNDGLNTVVPFRNDIYYQLRPQLALPASNVLKASDELGFHPALQKLYKTLAEASSSADYIYDKWKVFKSSAQYPDTALGKQLKTVAELIQSGIQSKVFYVSFSGFDTHVRQQPQHERLLNTYADALHSFVGDLEKSDDFKNVLVLTFSEFGRRVSQNASNGTDHGTANNVFIIGKQLKKAGFLNGTPNLTKLDNGDLIHEVDFRQVYATILNKWLGANDQIVLGKRFGQLQFI